MKPIDEKTLTKNDPPEMAWILVQDALKLLWVKNPKLHDIGGVIGSINKHGFQELPKFDVNLENTQGQMGAIKAGNGRIEALAQMEKDGRYELPRGLALTKDGKWAMPILTGTDAKSEMLAQSYAIDSNNLTLMGGGANVFEMAGMYEQDDYLALLQRLAEAGELPISVDGDDLDSLTGTFERPKFEGIIEEFSSHETETTDKDSNWFYIEFYGQDSRFAELVERLADRFKGQSKHELDGNWFYDLVVKHG